MKILRKTVSLLLILSLCTTVLYSCGKKSERDNYTQNLPITPSEPVKYSAGFSTAEAKKLYEAFEGKIKEVYGSNLPLSISLLEGSILDAIDALEARGVGEDKAKIIISRLYENTELFEDIIRAAKDKNALPLSAAISLFGELARTAGIKTTSLFLYDVMLIYCEYMENKYTQLYIKNPSLSYLFSYSLEWQSKYEKTKAIGENNFSAALRMLVSLSSLKSLSTKDENSFALALSSGELALFLNSEGEMLSGISMTNGDVEFILTELGGQDIPLFKAILKSGDSERLASHSEEILTLTEKTLKAFDSNSAKALYEGNLSRALYLVTREYGDEDWQRLSQIICGENEEKYKEYFTKQNLLNNYLSFKEETGNATLDELMAVGEDDFLSVLKAYMCSEAPALTFSVFGI